MFCNTFARDKNMCSLSDQQKCEKREGNTGNRDLASGCRLTFWYHVYYMLISVLNKEIICFIYRAKSNPKLPSATTTYHSPSRGITTKEAVWEGTLCTICDEIWRNSWGLLMKMAFASENLHFLRHNETFVKSLVEYLSLYYFKTRLAFKTVFKWLLNLISEITIDPCCGYSCRFSFSWIGQRIITFLHTKKGSIHCVAGESKRPKMNTASSWPIEVKCYIHHRRNDGN